MANATSTSRSKRRAATYGKSSRKRIAGFDLDGQRPLFAAFRDTKSIAKESSLSSNTVDRAEDFLATSSSKSHHSYPDKGLPPVRLRDGSPLAATPGAERAGRSTPIVLIRTPTKSRNKDPRPVPSNQMMSTGGLGVFDVPTSDENETDPRVNPKCDQRPENVLSKGREQLSRASGTGSIGHPTASFTTRIATRKGTQVAKPSQRLKAPADRDGILPSKTRKRDVDPLSTAQCHDQERLSVVQNRANLASSTNPISARARVPRKTESKAVEKDFKENEKKCQATLGLASASAIGTRTLEAERCHDTDDSLRLNGRVDEARARKRASRTRFSESSSFSDDVRDEGFRRTPRSPIRTPSPRKRQKLSHDLKTPPSHRFGVRDEGTPSGNESAGRIYSPRHARMWDQLLEKSPRNASPGTLPVERLGLSPSPRSATHPQDVDPASCFPSLSQSSGEHPQKRRRLIDTLVAQEDRSAESTSSEDSGPDGDGSDASISSSQARIPAALQTRNFCENDSSQPSQKLRAGSLPNSQPATSQLRVTSQLSGPKVTYSRQRSYLTEAPLEDDPLLGLPTGADDKQHDYRNRPRLSVRAFDPPMLSRTSTQGHGIDAEGNVGNVRSIHELREAGMNNRFLDEVEGLLEDIEDRAKASTSKRRISLLQLALKLTKKPFASRFAELTLERRLFVGLKSEPDGIAKIISASLIILLGRNHLASHSIEHILEQGALAMLTDLLPADGNVNAICKERNANMSRAAQSVMVSLTQHLEMSQIWSTRPAFVSPRLVALSALEILTGDPAGQVDIALALPSNAVCTIVDILVNSCDWSSSVAPPAQKLLELELGLSLLETCTTRPTFRFDTVAQEAALTHTIVELISYVCRDGSDQLKSIQASALRLFVNITNNNDSTTCKAVGTAEATTALTTVITAGFCKQEDGLDEDEKLAVVDHLILALAAMTNLVEASGAVQSHVLHQHSDGTSLLDAMLGPFVRGLKRASEADSMEGTHFNVAFGYLAVLLSTISLHPEARSHICSKLPGRTLAPVKDVAIEFLQYHQQVDSQLSEVDEGGASKDGFTDRLQSVIDRLSDA